MILPLVYVVRPGENNQALRMSLRSLANLPHEHVVIVGYTPSWVRGVESIEGNKAGGALANELDNLAIACHAFERFVVMNDDFYVVEHVTSIVPCHGGPIAEGDDRSTFGARVRDAGLIASLLGDPEPLVWARHTPFPVDAYLLRDALRWTALSSSPEWKTLYGNLTSMSGPLGPNAKVKGPRYEPPPGPYWSSSPLSMRFLWGKLQLRFPLPGPYELEGNP